MEKEEIINFRSSLASYSVEQLEDLLKDLNTKINQMILNSDLIMKVAIVDQMIKDKKGENDGEIE